MLNNSLIEEGKLELRRIYIQCVVQKIYNTTIVDNKFTIKEKEKETLIRLPIFHLSVYHGSQSSHSMIYFLISYSRRMLRK